MRHSNDKHQRPGIRYLVQDAIVADTQPPAVLCSAEFPAALRTRLFCQIVNSPRDPRALRRFERGDLSDGGGKDFDSVCHD